MSRSRFSYYAVGFLLIAIGLSAYLYVFTSTRVPDAEAIQGLETIKSRLRASLLRVDEETIRRMANRCAELLETIREDGTWPDIDYEDRSRYPWKPVEHLQRVTVLAQSYVTPGHPLTHSPELLGAARKGLSEWLDNDYESDNWWYIEIYVPKLLGSILLTLEGELNEVEIQRTLRKMKKSRWRGMTGQNLMWVAGNEILRGCLSRKPSVVGRAYKYLFKELEVAEEGEEGIQVDGSFHQHGPYLNSGSYGAGFAKDTARLVAAAWGTGFGARGSSLDAFLMFLLDGEQWMFANGMYDYSTWGRAIVRPKEKRARETFFNESITESIRSLSGTLTPRNSELKAFLARLERAGHAEPLIGHRHFWKSDYTVHRRAEYMVTLRMHSARTINSEYVNGEGGTTHHLADGAMFLYRQGNEYRDIFPVWDWRKIPGVTGVQSSIPLSPDEGLGVRGSTRCVGGVSNGTTGVSAMDLEKDSLVGKKAWFFFKDEIVCLGAGISSSGSDSVATSIEQRLLAGSVRVLSGSEVRTVTGAYSGRADRVLHDGVCYTVSPNRKMEIYSGPKQGRWSDIGTGPEDLVSKDVFQIWIDHGVGAREATYEYRVAPGASLEEREARSDPIKKIVLSNTANMQAVYDPSEKILQTVFWRKGSVETPEGWEFTVEGPSLFQAVIGATEVEFSFANPENEPLEVRLKTNLPLTGLNEWEWGNRGIRFDLPEADRAGSGLTRTIEIGKRGSGP